MTVPELAQQFRPFEFSLRIRHPDMDPAEISSALGLEPIYAFKAGEPRTTGSTPAAQSVHPESYWLANLEPLSATTAQPTPEASPETRVATVNDQERPQLDALGLALNVVVTGFARRHETFLSKVQLEGGQVTLLVAVMGTIRGFAITPEMSRMLEKSGMTVEFEFAEG